MPQQLMLLKAGLREDALRQALRSPSRKLASLACQMVKAVGQYANRPSRVNIFQV